MNEMPTLAEMSTACPSMAVIVPMVLMTRPATSRACRGLHGVVSTTVNSSPPSRATTSVTRMQPRTARPTSLSSRSPTLCPC
jgi:hypothetical protein